MLHVKMPTKMPTKILHAEHAKKKMKTQEHVLTACPAIHKDNTITVEKYEIFKENHQELAKTAKI